MDTPQEIYLLAGQSNMSGRAGLIDGPGGRIWDGVDPAGQREEARYVSRFSAENLWESPAKEPLHADIDTLRKPWGVGPGLAFAVDLIALRGQGASSTRLGLVPCAVGGTSMDEWTKGAPPSIRTDWPMSLYDRLIARAKAARGDPDSPSTVTAGDRNTSSPPASMRAPIKAMLWYQGESDTDTEEHASTYCARFQEFLANVRADLGMPDLPVVMVAVTASPELPTSWPFLSTVRQQQFLAATTTHRVAIVDAEGSQLQPDRVHLTTEAQMIMGNKLASRFRDAFDDASC